MLAIFYSLAIAGLFLLGLLPRDLTPDPKVVGQFVYRQLSLGGGPVCIPPAFLARFRFVFVFMEGTPSRIDILRAFLSVVVVFVVNKTGLWRRPMGHFVPQK